MIPFFRPPAECALTATDHWTPSWYVEGSSFQRDIALKVLAGLDFSDSRRILDLGCGDGMITRRIATSNPHARVHGLDLSRDMVEFAKASHQDVANLEFSHGDIQSFITNETYDYILSFWTLSWLKDHSAGARQIKAALKSGGGLYLMAPTTNPLIYETLDILLASPAWKERLKSIGNPSSTATLKQYQDLYAGPGMEAVKVRLERLTYRFKDRAALTAYMRGWMPHVKVLKDQERGSFLREFTALYSQKASSQGLPSNTVVFDCIIVERSPRCTR